MADGALRVFFDTALDVVFVEDIRAGTDRIVASSNKHHA